MIKPGKWLQLPFLNKLTMAQKLLLVFVFCVLLPMSLQNAFYYSDAEHNIQQEIHRRLAASLRERAQTINGLFSGVLSASLKFSTDEALYARLARNYENEIDYLMAYQDYFKTALQVDPAYRQVRDIVVYTDNETIFNGAAVRKLPKMDGALGEELLDFSWHPLTQSAAGPFLRIAVLKPPTASTYRRSISILRYLNHYPQHGQYQKLLRIDISEDELALALTKSELLENVLLVDSGNRVLAAARNYGDMGHYPIYQPGAAQGEQVLLEEGLKDIPQLRVLGIYNKRIFEEASAQARVRSLMIAGGGLLLAMGCILVITRSITRRLCLVTEQANAIAMGRFVTIDEEKLGNDEIALLARSSNRMSMQLQEAIEREYEARLRQTRLEQEKTLAKLQALQSQVDPHFMFNALASVKLKAMAKGEQETARMITYMSRMFRHLIEWEEDIIPLSEDLQFLKEYLAVQQYRFGDEFDYSLTVDAQAQDCYLPKMIIQPIVENACVHGTGAAGGRQLVEIAITCLDKRLAIAITDNGSGIPPKRLLALKSMLQGGEKLKGSIGLYNIYQRLKLYYGDDFILDVSSRGGSGAGFYLNIPMRTERRAF